MGITAILGSYNNRLKALVCDQNGVLMTSNGDSASQDAFGRSRTSQATAIFDDTFEYGIKGFNWESVTSGSGTVAKTANETSVTLTVPGLSARAMLQSHVYQRYQPGNSQRVVMTGVLSASATGTKSRIGYYDDNNGLFFETRSTGVGVVIRSNVTGSVVDTFIAQSSWDDKLDGTGASGLNIDFTKSQIFWIDFQWLSLGRVRFGIDVNGLNYYFHYYEGTANTGTGPYMNTANLPVRYELVTDGTATGAKTAKAICTSVASEGGVQVDSFISWTVDNSIAQISVGTAGLVPILMLRPIATFNSLTNRGHIEPVSIEIISDVKVRYVLLYGYPGNVLSFTNTPTWTDRDTTRSIAQYGIPNATPGTVSGGIMTGGGIIQTAGLGINTAGVDDFSLISRRPLQNDYAGTTADVFCIAAQSYTGTATVSASMNWREQF